MSAAAASAAAAAAAASAAALEFDKELLSLTESKLPVSASKIAAISKLALRHAKHYKATVHALERFVAKCRPEYRLAGLYVIDSIVRASVKQFGIGDSNVYLRRFEEKLESLFQALTKTSDDDKIRMKRVVALWQKSAIFNAELLEAIDIAFFPATALPPRESRQPSSSSSSVSSERPRSRDQPHADARRSATPTSAAHPYAAAASGPSGSTDDRDASANIETLGSSTALADLQQLHRPDQSPPSRDHRAAVSPPSQPAESSSAPAATNPLFFDYGDEDEDIFGDTGTSGQSGSTSAAQEQAQSSEAPATPSSATAKGTLDRPNAAAPAVEGQPAPGGLPSLSALPSLSSLSSLSSLAGLTSLQGLSGFPSAVAPNSAAQPTDVVSASTASLDGLAALQSLQGFEGLQNLVGQLSTYTSTPTSPLTTTATTTTAAAAAPFTLPQSLPLASLAGLQGLLKRGLDQDAAGTTDDPPSKRQAQ
ncbi:hypothetical protein BC831DRAFT_472980 [Entophlyctis helioformis]|nr:hypothetical protein BC831DRAFT_472980 [Entophlyctis helioformis]